MEITVNKRGQITIPKKIRDVSGIKPSRKLSLEFKNNKLYLTPEKFEIRTFNDKVIKEIITENEIDEKEFNQILKKWRKRRSS